MRKVEIIWFYLFITPWLVGFLALTVYPMIASAYYSLTDYSVLSPPRWVGFSNYVELFHDPLFWHSVYVTAIYAVCTVFIHLTLGLFAALLLNLRVPGMRLLRTVYYLPNVLPVASASMLWIFLFLPKYGLIDSILHQVLGVDGPEWLSDPNWALPALIIMSAWSIGSAMIIFLAGLQSIPAELYEAAEIDGASSFSKLFRITIPMLTPQILLNLILGLIGALQTFVQAYMMTQGGPDYSTYLYSLYIYQNAFQSFHMGMASAQAWVLFVVVLSLTAVIFKTSARWVYYGGLDF
ncbi:sugar ABC transporter permease [Alicyclobacillus cellulosilyticus]|uniref:Sugar ABC transporter permease n=1 Tax=Alicyclobacillus cellulosilyticus TaxID=1003997 RepID=A0A917KID4_9BACL|nr:sugar ABC transporter permease [Alicyclobacillus cellulosilyticus]GGJ13525.1 sugar ABC transporter permease [Alicyclobacillus cellulosilyticus]